MYLVPGSLRIALATLCGVLLQTAPATQVVAPPAGWASGDVHEMIQLCTVGGTQPPDRTIADVYAEMQAKNLNFMDVLVLVTGNAACETYLTQYAPRVTGLEESITAGDPNRFIQYGIEFVGGPNPSCSYPTWGHATTIGANNGYYLLDADYPGLNLDLYREKPGTITGYAHVSWPTGTRVPQDFPPIVRSLTRLYPLLAPFDIALGKVDFISTADVAHGATQISPDPWWGLYYKLLNAGLPISITAGSVAQCYLGQATLDPRTWALTGGAPLSHASWVDAIKNGRTSVSEGGEDFLLLDVLGQQVGSRLYLSSPAQVTVTAELRTSVPRTTTIEIVQNGVVIATEAVQLNAAGSHIFSVQIPVLESGWIVARTQRAHTAAIYTHLDNQPVTDAASAEYFRALSIQIDDFLDVATAICAACPQTPCSGCIELEAWVGNSEEAIRADLAKGARVYKALRDHDQPLPKKVVRYGSSTPSCRGPIAIGIAGPPVVGRPATLTCFNAPPNSTGALVFGRSSSNGTPYGGATLYVGQVPQPQVRMVTSDAAGFASVTMAVPASAFAIDAYFQFFFDETTECSTGTGQVASDALKVHIPRSLFSEF